MVEAAPASTKSLLDRASGMLAGSVAEPRRTAFSLLAHLLGGSLRVVTAETVDDPDVVAEFRALVVRVAEGEPLPYALGETRFRTLRLAVGPGVLIPRPETEGLVQLALDWSAGRAGQEGLSALDLGTGSGCIALSLAAEGKFSRVVGTDVSRVALDMASRNADLNELRGIDLREGPFFEPVMSDRFDVIVSNPPYVAPDEYPGLDDSVLHHEPRGALVSEAGGLEHTESILSRARNHLVEGGLLALEIDSRRAGESLEIASGHGWLDTVVKDDVFGRPRYLTTTATPA